MKRLWYLLLLLPVILLESCNTAPVIVPDTTKDNVVMEKLKWGITNNNNLGSNWGWILWYLPLVALAMMWGWRQFIKPCPDCEEKQNQQTDK